MDGGDKIVQEGRKTESVAMVEREEAFSSAVILFASTSVFPRNCRLRLLSSERKVKM